MILYRKYTRTLSTLLWNLMSRNLTSLRYKCQFLIKSFCLRDRGRLGNRGRPIWLKFGTLSYYGDLCNMPKFQLHCPYLGWVIDVSLFGVPQCFFIAHFGHFSILWLQCQGYFKPNINSLFIISIPRGFYSKTYGSKKYFCCLWNNCLVNALKDIFSETKNNPNLSRIYLSAHFWNNTIPTWAESLALGM